MSNVTRAVKISDFASEQLAAISRLFSSTVIHEMARKGESPLFARLVNQSRQQSHSIWRELANGRTAARAP